MNVLIVLCSFLCLNVALAQTPGLIRNPKQQKQNAKPASKELSCYSCQFSFNDVYDIDNRNAWCTNETLMLTAKSEVIKPCAPWEPWCITAVTTTLNSFTSVSRSCAVRCSTLCESIGYGQNQVTCTDCCRSNGCNKKFSVDYYLQVMERQYVGWTRPLQAERDYNKKNSIRFPY